MLIRNRRAALKGMVAAALVLAASPAAAQREARVTFAPGASATTLDGRIRGNEGVTYILGARAGQRMRITFTPSNASANFNVFAPGQATAIFMGAAGGHSFSGVLPASGDYRVQVYLMRNAARRNESASYKIRFAIAGAASTAKPDGSATSGVDTSKAIAACKAALSARIGAARGDIAVVETLWGQAGIGVTMTAAGSDKRWSCLSDASGHVQGLN